MGKHVDKTKDYGKYRTLSILPAECKTEYEKAMQPDPINGIYVYTVLNISSKEAASGVEKELDVIVAGVKKRILVKVPEGMENGKYIRYREKGEPGKFGGKNGDLYVRVVVEPAAAEENKEPEKEAEPQKTPVNGQDINCTLQITNEEWVKGVEKEKEVTIDGVRKNILVKVPPAIQNGTAIRYKGKGEAGKYGGKNGDLYIRIVVAKEQKRTDSDSQTDKPEEKAKAVEPEISETNHKDTGDDKAEQKTTQSKREPSVPTEENTISIDIKFLEAAKGTEKEVILPERVGCKKCKGTGNIKNKPCPKCDGVGKVDALQKIRVKIPAGIDEGQLLRLKGKDVFPFEDIFREFFENSENNLNTKNKLSHDWYVKIHIEKHPKFERKGYDVYSTEYIPVYIGTGRMVGVDILDGKQYCNITKEIKDGSRICLKNKGIPNLNNPSVRGDHYVTWKKK